jgi:hypothetical protein
LLLFCFVAQAGLLVFPIAATSIARQLIRKLHPLLVTTASCLIPVTIIYDEKSHKQTLPLSVSAVVSVVDMIDNSVGTLLPLSSNGLSTNDLNSNEQAKIVLTSLLHGIFKALSASLRSCQTDLDDIVPFGNVPCKDWLLSLTSLMPAESS